MKTQGTVRPAVFLDRDGTINEEREYLHRIEDFAFISGVPESIRRLKDAGFLVIVVTNQSGVARGYYGEREVAELHEHIQRQLEVYEVRIDAFYHCPHHPTEGTGDYRIDCDCRKGSPGMLLQAAREHDIDLARSFMIGDKLADVEAGNAAGCTPILVRTGYGVKDEPKILARFPETRVFRDLAEAADCILRDEELVKKNS